MDKNNNYFIDMINLVSFIIGYLNYKENVDQSTLDDELQKAVNVINEHLVNQDNKIDLIMKQLGVNYNEQME